MPPGREASSQQDAFHRAVGLPRSWRPSPELEGFPPLKAFPEVGDLPLGRKSSPQLEVSPPAGNLRPAGSLPPAGGLQVRSFPAAGRFRQPKPFLQVGDHSPHLDGLPRLEARGIDLCWKIGGIAPGWKQRDCPCWKLEGLPPAGSWRGRPRLEAGGVAPGWKLEGLRPAGSWRDCPRPHDFSWKGPGVKHSWLEHKFF